MAKTDYKANVLDYLKQHIDEDITRDELIQNTGISKSRLSEILNSIREDGYVITTPPRSGIVKLENSNLTILPTLKDSDVRQWLILFLLSRFGKLTFRDLVLKTLQVKEYNFIDAEYLLRLNNRNVYDDNHIIKSIRVNGANNFLSEEEIQVASDFVSVTTLRKDLYDLRNQGFVKLNEEQKVTYEMTAKAPFLIPISEESLLELCQKYEDNQTVTTELVPLKSAYKKMQMILNLEDSEKTQRRFGKINQISKKQIQTFNDFISHPYKTNRLQINSSFNDKERHDVISVGLLFYSIETSSFYALVNNHTQNRIESIRLDYIDSIDDLDTSNTIFHSDTYYKMYDEMFSAGFDPEVSHVKVLFQDFGNIVTRFKNLETIRNTSSIRLINNPPENCVFKYVYEDDVRGLYDFAKFLRSFGYSVLAVEPPELKDIMTNTYNRALQKYNELDVIINE